MKIHLFEDPSPMPFNAPCARCGRAAEFNEVFYHLEATDDKCLGLNCKTCYALYMLSSD